MKTMRTHFALAIAVLAFAALLGLAACSTENESSDSSEAGYNLTGGVAATVNGKEILEDDVTRLAMSWRTMNGLTDEDAWGNYLVSVGEDVASFREMMIDSFIAETLVAQAAEEMELDVSDEELDEAVASMRANYASDEAWQEALAQAGTSEEAYRESVYKSMLENKVSEKVAEDAGPVSDEDLLETAQMYADYIDGSHRSSHILFNLEDEDTANEVLEKLRNGEIDFADAATEYSEDKGSAANGGDVGWDKISGGFVTEYQTALDELEMGEMSDLVESQYGYHIILCTDIYNAPEDGITSIDQVPEELVEVIQSELESSAQTTAISEWYEEYKEAADIVVNDMPEGLPYDIDLTNYQTEDEESSDGDLIVETTPEDADSSEDASDGEDGEADADADADAEATDEASTEDADANDAAAEQPAEVSSAA